MCVFSDDFCSDRILCLKTLSMKQYMYTEVRPTCVEVTGVEMLTLIGSLCCVGFVKSIGVVAGFGDRD
jgi:hypothetical protein